jgi:hypothetical protein
MSTSSVMISHGSLIKEAISLRLHFPIAIVSLNYQIQIRLLLKNNIIWIIYMEFTSRHLKIWIYSLIYFYDDFLKRVVLWFVCVPQGVTCYKHGLHMMVCWEVMNFQKVELGDLVVFSGALLLQKIKVVAYGTFRVSCYKRAPPHSGCWSHHVLSPSLVCFHYCDATRKWHN